MGAAPAQIVLGHITDPPEANGAFAVFSTLPSDPAAIQADHVYTDTFIVPYTNGSAVEFTSTGNLAKAHLKATVPVRTCKIGADASQSCRDETRELSAAWTGYGGMLGSGKRLYRYSTNRFRWVLHTNGIFRLADVRATVDNVDLGGSQYAELGHYNNVAVIISFDGRC